MLPAWAVLPLAALGALCSSCFQMICGLHPNSSAQLVASGATAGEFIFVRGVRAD